MRGASRRRYMKKFINVGKVGVEPTQTSSQQIYSLPRLSNFGACPGSGADAGVGGWRMPAFWLAGELRRCIKWNYSQPYFHHIGCKVTQIPRDLKECAVVSWRWIGSELMDEERETAIYRAFHGANYFWLWIDGFPFPAPENLLMNFCNSLIIN